MESPSPRIKSSNPRWETGRLANMFCCFLSVMTMFLKVLVTCNELSLAKSVQEKLSGSERKKLQTLQPSSKNQALLVRLTVWLYDARGARHVYHDVCDETHDDRYQSYTRSFTMLAWMGAYECAQVPSEQSTNCCQLLSYDHSTNLAMLPIVATKSINKFCF